MPVQLLLERLRPLARAGETEQPATQLTEAAGLVAQPERSLADGADEAEDVLDEHQHHRVAPAVAPARVEGGGAVTPVAGARGAAGVVAAEVEDLGHLVERALQHQARHEGAVGVVVAVVLAHAAQHVGAHHTVEVVAARNAEQAAQPGGGVRVGGVERVVHLHDHLAVVVDVGVPGVREDHLGVLVELLDAQLDEPRRVEVVVRGPLEVLPPRQGHQQVVVGAGADVDGLPHVADARVPLGVRTADLLGAVARGVVADDQLVVGVGLGQQRVQRLGEVLLAVVDGQADGERGGPAAGGVGARVSDGGGHVLIPSGRRSGTASRPRPSRCSSSARWSWTHQTRVPSAVAMTTPQQEPRAPPSHAPVIPRVT